MKCPCGSAVEFAACCGLYLGGQAAPTAQALMRSRYTAHVRQEIDYLMDTWAAEQRVAVVRQDVARWAADSKWLSLQIIACERGTASDDDGVVEFRATFRARGVTQVHHERSTFRRENGRWYYVDGHTPVTSGKRA